MLMTIVTFKRIHTQFSLVDVETISAGNNELWFGSKLRRYHLNHNSSHLAILYRRLNAISHSIMPNK